MAKYRKRPIVVEAEQFSQEGTYDTWPTGVYYDKDEDSFKIDTLDGVHVVGEGDWIVTGVKGERYPCKPDIFAMTYDSVEKESPRSGRMLEADEETSKRISRFFLGEDLTTFHMKRMIELAERCVYFEWRLGILPDGNPDWKGRLDELADRAGVPQPSIEHRRVMEGMEVP